MKVHRPQKKLISIAEAADYIGVSSKSIRRYIASGRLTAYRAGPRLVRIDINELEAMLRQIPSASVGAS